MRASLAAPHCEYNARSPAVAAVYDRRSIPKNNPVVPSVFIRADISLHEKILLDVRANDIAHNCHPAPQGTEANRPRPGSRDRLNARDRLAAQRDYDWLVIFPRVFQNIDASRFQFRH